MHVNPSPEKKFEPTKGKFVDVMANGSFNLASRGSDNLRFLAMIFEMNPELGTMRIQEKGNKVLREVTHVIRKMRQPHPAQTLNDTQEESSQYTQTPAQGSSGNSECGIAKISTKKVAQDKVTKRSNAKQAAHKFNSSAILELESMAANMSQNGTETLESISKPVPNPADHVQSGVLLQEIDDTNELFDDEILESVLKPVSNPADWTLPGILLRKIDETYEFSDDE